MIKAEKIPTIKEILKETCTVTLNGWYALYVLGRRVIHPIDNPEGLPLIGGRGRSKESMPNYAESLDLLLPEIKKFSHKTEFVENALIMTDCLTTNNGLTFDPYSAIDYVVTRIFSRLTPVLMLKTLLITKLHGLLKEDNSKLLSELDNKINQSRKISEEIINQLLQDDDIVHQDEAEIE